MLCKEDNKEVLVSQNVGGGKLLERSFHFDKVLVLTQAPASFGLLRSLLIGTDKELCSYGGK